MRESEISKETGIGEVGAICLSCGHRQSNATGPVLARHFLPVEWETDAGPITTAYVETLNRAKLH